MQIDHHEVFSQDVRRKKTSILEGKEELKSRKQKILLYRCKRSVSFPKDNVVQLIEVDSTSKKNN